MNSRGKHLVNLITKTNKDFCKTVRESNIEKSKPESPVPDNYTNDEWKFLNEIYDDETGNPSTYSTKATDLTENFYASDIIYDNIIPDSTEITPIPSPTSAKDFYTDQQTTADTPNVPSVNSLISLSDLDDNISTPKSCKRKITYKTDPGRKRKRHVSQWIDVKRKLLTNSGQSYISKRGKIVSAKKMKRPCPDTCKLKCSQEFTEDERKTIFNEFWGLSDHAMQWEYINKFTKRTEKNRKTTNGPSRRQFTTKYFLPKPIDFTYTHKNVCLKMFCATLAVSDQFIRTAQSKLDITGVTGKDNRGKHINHPKKIDEEMIRSVCDHVKSFQPIESHYTRKSSNKLYLDNTLSFAKMFTMYKEWQELNNYTNQAENERQYRSIVNDNLNIAFFMPKKDLCDKCHAFSNEKSPSAEQIQTQQKHIKNKQTARKFKADDKEEAIQSSSKVVCASFDFQKILNCPYGEVSLFYYKRKLSVMNLTIFDAGKKEAYCYLWPEIVAKRGANEVSSCLLNFIELKVAEGAEDFRFWSDNCAGQNRNRVVYSFYLYISKKLKIDITHRFLESGHTQQEADSVHALIERSAKGKIIYSPDQWYALIRWAKTHNEPYRVIEVTHDILFDFKFLLDNRNWKKNTQNQDVKWNNIKEIHVKKSEPNVIYYKYDLECDYMVLNTLVHTRRNKKNSFEYRGTVLKQLYLDYLPISDAKYKDLMSLCNASLIPKQYHTFYKNLKVTQDVHESDEED